jgi:hypothetical protein
VLDSLAADSWAASLPSGLACCVLIISLLVPDTISSICTPIGASNLSAATSPFRSMLRWTKSIISPNHYRHDPVQTTRMSVRGAIAMLGLVKRLRCGATSDAALGANRHCRASMVRRHWVDPCWTGSLGCASFRAPRRHRPDGAGVASEGAKCCKAQD